MERLAKFTAFYFIFLLRLNYVYGFRRIFVDNLQWDICFNELVAYKASHGHCHVLSSDITALSRWAKTQRMQYQLLGQKQLSSLTPTRISRLEGIGFNWAVKDGLDKRGWLQVSPLIQYKRNKFVNSSVLGTKKKILFQDMKNQESNITKIPLKPDKCSSISYVSTSNSINLLYANYVKKKNSVVADKVLSTKVNTSFQGSTVPDEALSNKPISMKRKSPLVLNAKWKCDVCENAYFDSSSEALEHARACLQNKRSL